MKAAKVCGGKDSAIQYYRFIYKKATAKKCNCFGSMKIPAGNLYTGSAKTTTGCTANHKTFCIQQPVVLAVMINTGFILMVLCITIQPGRYNSEVR